MPDEAPTASANRELTAEIVAAYLRRNQTAFDQLATLISTVHQAVAGLGKPPAEAVVERTPAVSIRRSITANSVICLDCGWKGQMLRRHLTTAHGLTAELGPAPCSRAGPKRVKTPRGTAIGDRIAGAVPLIAPIFCRLRLQSQFSETMSRVSARKPE